MSVNVLADTLLSPKGLSPPHRTGFLLIRMSVCQKLRCLTLLPKRWQAGSSFVKLCTALFYSAMSFVFVCGWRVCEHVCLNSISLLSVSSLPTHFHLTWVHLPWDIVSQGRRLFGCLGHFCCGDLELCTCQYWGVVSAVGPTMRLLRLSCRSLLLSPELYLFCLSHQYYCQHIKWFSNTYQCGLVLCQPCSADILRLVLFLQYKYILKNK